MKKLFQNPIVAWGILILAVVVGVIIGQIRKPAYLAKEEAKKATALLAVEKYEWVNDSADMLSGSTEKTVKQYNTDWNGKYYSVVAVATVPTLKGWTIENYAAALGEKWTLGAGDMLLLLVRDGDWYVACGDNVARTMTDTQETNLKKAIDEPYYTKDYDLAVEEFFRQADVFYAQAGVSGGGSSSGDQSGWQEGAQPAKTKGGGVNIFLVILMIGGIFLVWAIIDRIRYSRYQRRAAVSTSTVSYYPIFWGRPTRAAAPAPAPQPRPQSGVYHSPARPTNTAGTYHAQKPGVQRPGAQKPIIHKPINPQSGARPTDTATGTPAKPVVTKPANPGKTGFGGGKR